MDEKTRLRILLEKFLENDLSGEEKTVFFQAITDSRQETLVDELMLEVWDASGKDLPESPSPQSLRRIDQILHQVKPRIERRIYWPWMAAAVVLAAVITIGLRYYSGRDAHQPPLVVTSAHEKKTLRLPDGSLVTLKAGSSISYNKNFNQQNREVNLRGEAFFDVAQNSRQPFIVNSSHQIRTEVLGTAFFIRNYEVETLISISVVSGKIRVLNNNHALSILEKSARLVYNKNSEQFSIQSFDTKKDWNDSQLVFESNSLKEVLGILSSTYGIDISLADDVPAGLRVRASFREEQGLDKILELICQLHDLHFTKTDHHIIIHKHK